MGVSEQTRVTPDKMLTQESLIERWLPIDVLGVESRRENSTGQHPAPNRLHVWWARRPLIVSRASILASVLPAWNESWPDELSKRFPTEEIYHNWFKGLLGVQGDPVVAAKLLAWARRTGTKIANPYTGPRAFTISPSQEDLLLLSQLLEHQWGTSQVAVLDPTAGGGSIPFESLRYAFATYANELNPVASVVLAATLDYPSRFGRPLTETIKYWGNELSTRVRRRLQEYYPTTEGETPLFYLWARTVACPSTSKPVPLSPNWWLKKGADPVAVEVLSDPEWQECRFRVVRGKAAQEAKPDQGTVKRGVAVSPWTGEVIDGDYIKREAQAGRMGQQLYAVGIQTSTGRDFRAPTDLDSQGYLMAVDEARLRESSWAISGLIPTSDIPDPTNYARGHRLYGMTAWKDLFSARQLLALAVATEIFRELRRQIEVQLDQAEAKAVITYLAFAVDKLADYNSRMTRLDVTRGAIKNTFDRHGYSLKWSYGEMNVVAPGLGLDWVTSSVADAYNGVATLANPSNEPFWSSGSRPPGNHLVITQGDAAELSAIADESIHLVCVDPPYYDNVQYSELADFFYVWEKQTIGDIYSSWFLTETTNKDDEAVANPARFADFGSKRRELAKQDYERKMGAIFREANRVLVSHGVLTIMFTHKQVAAWDTLANAMISAGFQIQASWPVHTESEHSLHQAEKNAAASTILLVCRKRDSSGAPVWWDEIKGQVRRVAREKASIFANQGITGVDLYISAFGPALSVISEQWPVLTSEVDPKTGQPKPLRPEVALDLAREEVINLRKEGLLAGRQVQFDPATDWYLMAWDAFQAAEFPGDEARKLALALGLDLEDDIIRRERLAAKKASTVVLQTPKDRRRRDVVDPEAAHFPSLIDAVHTAMLVYEEDGPKACEQFLKRNQLLTDDTFKACLQALINAIPRTRMKDRFARTEAETLDRLRQAFFEDLQVPVEESPAEVFQQASLLSASSANEDTEDDVDDEEDDE